MEQSSKLRYQDTKTYATFYQRQTAVSSFSQKQFKLLAIDERVFKPHILRLDCFYMSTMTCGNSPMCTQLSNKSFQN